MATTLKSETVTIRKEHQCFACYRKFQKGTKMNFWVGVCNGDFNSVYSCMTCMSIMSTCDEEEFENGYVHEMLERGQTPEQLLSGLETIKTT